MKKLLALGDSYTIGEGVKPAERWPNQLVELIRAQGVEIADPVMIAATGWTTNELAAGIDSAAPHGPFGLVTLLIGFNNQYRGLSPIVYQRDCRALLDRAIALASGQASRVIVLSIPDWGATPFATQTGRNTAKIGWQIDLFNEINFQEAFLANTLYVSLTHEFCRSVHLPGFLAEDGLHPSGRMYAAWAQLVLPAALAALKRQ